VRAAHVLLWCLPGAALAHAVELAKDLDASITLANVYTPPLEATSDAMVMMSDLVGSMIAQAQRSLEAAIEEHAGSKVPIIPELRSGATAEVISEIAIHCDADLIVVGTHGRSGIGRFLLGSVAEDIVRTATRPVLVFRDSSKSGERS